MRTISLPPCGSILTILNCYGQHGRSWCFTFEGRLRPGTTAGERHVSTLVFLSIWPCVFTLQHASDLPLVKAFSVVDRFRICSAQSGHLESVSTTYKVTICHSIHHNNKRTRTVTISWPEMPGQLFETHQHISGYAVAIHALMNFMHASKVVGKASPIAISLQFWSAQHGVWWEFSTIPWWQARSIDDFSRSYFIITDLERHLSRTKTTNSWLPPRCNKTLRPTTQYYDGFGTRL